jgi:SWI/SNF-related matrix-associated actin-dependent regulator of chromatin subfamily A-like protein 1
MRIIENNGFFEIHFSYSAQMISAVKKIPGRIFDYNRKLWRVPITKASRSNVKAFADNYGFQMGAPEDERFNKPLPPMPLLKASDEMLKQYLKLIPYDYQKEGIAYCLSRKKVIIGDQPGLGKTMQAIATVTLANAFPALVICPASLKENWKREFEMWTDKKVVILNNSNKDTWHLFAKGQTLFGNNQPMAQVFITNYESLKKFFVSRIDKPTPKTTLTLKHVKFKQHIQLFKSVIIDESHRVKDTKTQQTKFTKGIAYRKEYILALTGTPVVNKPVDLVSQLAIIEQLQRFGGYKFFLQRYCAGEDNGHSHLKELNYYLKTHCFYRREKKEVLKQLPDKVRQIVSCDIVTRKEYNEALADLETYLKKYKQATDEQIARAMRGEVMVRIGHLKRISARGKLNDVVSYVSDIIESGEKIVIFIHHKENAEHLKKMFPASVTVLGNNTSAEKQTAIDRFQKDPECQTIICSIKAAGVGITLTASSRVAFVELPWHPADTEQCEDRCHRIGQKDSVQCIYFLGKQTIDEDIYKLIDKKRGISDTITGAKNDVETSMVDSLIDLLNKQKAQIKETVS